jgi:hypothetical protein
VGSRTIRSPSNIKKQAMNATVSSDTVQGFCLITAPRGLGLGMCPRRSGGIFFELSSMAKITVFRL